MAFSKAPQFPELPFQQSFWSRALSHPARIIILEYLLQHGTTPFKDLCKLVPLARTTVSQHVRILLTYGLIEVFEKTPFTYYSLDKKNCKNLAFRITDLNLNFVHRID